MNDFHISGSFEETVRKTSLAEGQIALFYLGQEGYLFHTNTCNILIDPYLSDSIDARHGRKDPDWTRNYPAPVSGEEAAFVDYVFCSHNHTDHTDPWTLSAIAGAGTHTKFFASRVFADELKAYGVPEDRLFPLDAGKELHVKGLDLLPIPAAHEELHLSDKGYAELSFLMHMEGLTVFHGGDCCPYDGLAEAIGDVDLMMLPVNGRDYYRRRDQIIGNCNTKEAALLAKACHAHFLIPMHYDLYPENSVPESEIAGTLAPTGLRYHLFRPGERMIYAG